MAQIKNGGLMSRDRISNMENIQSELATATKNGSHYHVFEQRNENKLPKLQIISQSDLRNGSSVNGINNCSKETCIMENSITEFVADAKIQRSSSPCSPKLTKPIMGKSALLKRANIEKTDSRIIYELITSKYNGVLDHYFNRMYQRRKSKLDSSEEEYSDTIFSSPPNYSPVSISSIDTPCSMSFDDKNRFYFPKSNLDTKDLNFLKSTDDNNIDTTNEDVDASSLTSSHVSHDKSTASDYDANKFLENAIGGISNGSTESGIERNEESTNPKSDTKNSSVGLSDISSLVSKASCLYSSVKKSVGRRNSTKKQAPIQEENSFKQDSHSFISENSLLDNLMKELSLQNEILFQVSKAINYCRTKKSFQTSVEFIEAERILLLASCTKAALIKEIEYVDDDIYEKTLDTKSSGQIQLSSLKFFIKEDSKREEMLEQFVVIFTCGSTVLASDVIKVDDDGIINIYKNFEFKDLAIDFEIMVCIYAMTIHHNQEQAHCPLPKKFFHRISRKYRITNDDPYIKPSSFALWGRCDIRGFSLKKIKSSDDTSPSLTLKMYNVPSNSYLSDMFSLNMKSYVKLNTKINGFLTIGLDNEHGCSLWNRRWCVLEGTILKYWNYPSEEVANPLGSLDLSNCLDQEISTVDRSFCPRPRTLMMSVKYKESERKFLLSADTLPEMKQWKEELNYVIRILNMWNCGSAKLP